MREYTTERGVTVGVVPIPMLLDEIRKAHQGPPRPTYTEKVAGGGTQEIEITDADAEAWQERDSESWAEHAEKWEQYIVERDAAQEQMNDRIWQAVMRRAIVLELPDDNDWVLDQEELGLTVPKDKRERRMHYIRTEVIGGIRDVLRLSAIANGTELSEEAVSLAEASFRHSLAQSLLRGLTGQGRAVDAGDEGGTGEGSERVGAET